MDCFAELDKFCTRIFPGVCFSTPTPGVEKDGGERPEASVKHDRTCEGAASARHVPRHVGWSMTNLDYLLTDQPLPSAVRHKDVAVRGRQEAAARGMLWLAQPRRAGTRQFALPGRPTPQSARPHRRAVSPLAGSAHEPDTKYG